MKWKFLIYSIVIASMIIFSGCIEQGGDKCLRRVVPSNDLQNPPPLVTNVIDSKNDYILDHPILEEVYDITYENYDVIPSALDISSVEVFLNGDNYYFSIQTRDDLSQLFIEGQHSAQFGIYIDKDLNGCSDIFLTTTEQPGVCFVLKPGLICACFKFIDDTPMTINGNKVVMHVPRNIVGDNFDWLVTSGFTPDETVYHPTPLDDVFFVPVVDVVYTCNCSVAIETLYVGPGQCFVYYSGYTTCPVYGTDIPHMDVPYTRESYRGVDLEFYWCDDGSGRDWWCIEQDFFALRVFKGPRTIAGLVRGNKGWIGRCPFAGGINFVATRDVNVPPDWIPDLITHTVTDPGDQDGDGREDVMWHQYYYPTNTIWSCNKERNRWTGELTDERCLGSRSPYDDPMDVPGSIP